MKSESAIKDTWVRPIGRGEVESVISSAQKRPSRDNFSPGRRPGDLFRVAEEAPVETVRLSEDAPDRKGFGRW